MKSCVMVSHCIEDRRREIFAIERCNLDVFFIKISQLKRNKTCSHGVMVRIALNESDIRHTLNALKVKKWQ